MKNIKKILMSILLIVVSFSLIYMPVRADSGWDSSYDSGSWDSGSDWGSDYDSDWGSSSWGSSGSSYSGSSDSDPMVTIVVFVIIIIIVYNLTKNNKNRPNGGSRRQPQTKSNNYQDVDTSKITEIDPSLNSTEFKMKAFNIYRDLQTAWMNFDTDTIRKLKTDEIYNMYSSQLETLKLKNQKNIMTNITLEEVKIIDIKKENNVITVNTYMRVKCYDYVIKEATGETVRGKDKQKIIIEYVLSFVKSSVNNNKE